AQVGLVAAVYPGVWSVAQIATGHWSDTIGRKPLIVAGMLLQSAALAALALSGGRVAIATATAALLGIGTAMVYPTLIAAMSDSVSPIARAPVVGVSRRRLRPRPAAIGARRRGRAAAPLGPDHSHPCSPAERAHRRSGRRRRPWPSIRLTCPGPVPARRESFHPEGQPAPGEPTAIL